MSDNVEDLLNSLDVKQSTKSKPKKSTTKRKEGARKAAGEDILGFLDELDKRDPKKTTASTNAQADSKEASPVSANGAEKAESPPTTASKADGEDAERSIAAEGSEARHKPVTRLDSKPLDSTNANGGAESAESDNQPTESSEADLAPVEIDPVASITSWWSRNKGGLWSTAKQASAQLQDAVSETVKQARQAEASLREDQPQFSLNALQTRLSSVLNTIIPPISRHEQLRIHIFHDMVGYPNVDKLLYEVFDYVMDQVEGGGDLNLVVQKGRERHRVGSDHEAHRDLNLARCSLKDAAKLAKANVESIPATDSQPEGGFSHPNVRVSEIYIAIQPVLVPAEASNKEELVNTTGKLYFVIYLLDKEHSIEITTPSQGMPEEWAQWLDSSDTKFEDAAFDPREWIYGWVEDALNLAFGVTAQTYVTTRMGLAAEPNAAE